MTFAGRDTTVEPTRPGADASGTFRERLSPSGSMEAAFSPSGAFAADSVARPTDKRTSGLGRRYRSPGIRNRIDGCRSRDPEAAATTVGHPTVRTEVRFR